MTVTVRDATLPADSAQDEISAAGDGRRVDAG
jgi:hypothetical protein